VLRGVLIGRGVFRGCNSHIFYQQGRGYFKELPRDGETRIYCGIHTTKNDILELSRIIEIAVKLTSM
jgi:hypothetical protein